MAGLSTNTRARYPRPSAHTLTTHARDCFEFLLLFTHLLAQFMRTDMRQQTCTNACCHLLLLVDIPLLIRHAWYWRWTGEVNSEEKKAEIRARYQGNNDPHVAAGNTQVISHPATLASTPH
jgi:hypothetical protein